MLRRVNAGLYEEDDGADIQLVVKATSNAGVEAAQFDYDSTVLPQGTIMGSPGGHFAVKSGIRQFRVLVAFSPAAPPTARYELFQVNAAGGLTAVGKSVTNSSGTPLIGFGIDGVAVGAAVGAAAGRRKRPKPARRTRHKTMLTDRKPTVRAKPAGARKAAARKAKPKVTARKATARKATARKVTAKAPARKAKPKVAVRTAKPSRKPAKKRPVRILRKMSGRILRKKVH